MKKTTLICAIAACAALAGVPASASDPAPGYDYVMGFHFASVGGKSSSFYYDIATTVAELAVAETGFKVEIRRFPSHEAVTAAFIANKIDGGLLDNGAIMEIIESGGEVHPWATYVIGKERKNKICVWHRKQDSFKNISDLEGKNLLSGASEYFGYLEIREHLAASGIDKPLWNVFKGFTVAPNSNTSFMMLAKRGRRCRVERNRGGQHPEGFSAGCQIATVLRFMHSRRAQQGHDRHQPEDGEKRAPCKGDADS